MLNRIRRFIARKSAAIRITTAEVSYTPNQFMTDLVATFVLAVLLFSFTKTFIPSNIFMGIAGVIVIGYRFSRQLISSTRYVLAA